VADVHEGQIELTFDQSSIAGYTQGEAVGEGPDRPISELFPATLIGKRGRIAGSQSCCGLICPDTTIGGKSAIWGVKHDSKKAQNIRSQPEAGSGPDDQ
jgi:hypothetical protein